ncbi:hypothetical protein [Rhizobium leguminosarum]|uniref:hypothetical protein n=1 Tax=Rhizobium leguminosarum TaxID=384 RepID=UPI00123762CE|nr:hypothetical protein [Rhizobium leguminosarum]
MPNDADVVSAAALVVKPPVGQESKFNRPTRIFVRRDNCAADFQMTVIIVVTTANMWRIRDAEPEPPIPPLDFNDVSYLFIRRPFSTVLELGSPFVVYHALHPR